MKMGDTIELEKLLAGYNITFKKENNTHYVNGTSRLNLFRKLNEVFSKYDLQQTYKPENDLVIITKQEYQKLIKPDIDCPLFLAKITSVGNNAYKQEIEEIDLNDPRR